MAALSTALEYAAVREAIQRMTTLDSDGNRQDFTSFSIGDLQVTFPAGIQLSYLQAREQELARRLTIRNVRKRTSSDYSGSAPTTLPVS